MKSLIAIALLAASAGSVVIAASTGGSPAPATPSETSEPSLEEQRRAFFEDALAPTVKPAEYDVTIVEYTDYQCPFCRAAHDALTQLAESDEKVRIVYRDWPIFGPQSERAARLAIASQWQGKHAAFHDALMKAPRPLNEDAMKAAARKAGVDWARLQADLKERGAEVEALLSRNDQQAISLGLEGTPGFIIGETLYPGVMELADLKEAVAEAREAKPAASEASPEGI